MVFMDSGYVDVSTSYIEKKDEVISLRRTKRVTLQNVIRT